jgi:L-alanine-DL-glutamate epimerase-like enolase superfamily enzyme
MKITGCNTTIVSIPYSKPYRWRVAESAGITAVIVELLSDNGLVGIGESPCLFPPAEAFEAVIQTSAEAILGEDPFDHERIYKKLLGLQGLYYDRVFGGLALSGLDLALWDLMGKAVGLPLYKLIGGSFYRAAPFICIVPIGQPTDMAAAAQTAVAEGCRTLYVKYCDDEQELIERLQAIRGTVGPGIKIRVDFNQALSPGFAVKFISQELEAFNLEAVEQPCGEEDLDGMRHVRCGISTPVIADESAKTLYHALNVIRAGAADVIQLDHFTTDGIWGARKICGVAEAAGLPVVFHSLGEFGLNQMKTVHLAVSTPNATMDHQTLYDYNSDDILLGGMLPFDRWTMRPNDQPGLGLQLDRQKMERYAALYQSTGGMYLTQSSQPSVDAKIPLISARISRSWTSDGIAGRSLASGSRDQQPK